MHLGLQPHKQSPAVNYLLKGLDSSDRWITGPERIQLEQDAEKWIIHFYPKQFGRQMTAYQSEFWKFGTNLANIRLEDPEADVQPRVECEPRGVGKSTSLRGLIVYLLARKIKFYVLYVSATDRQAKKHFGAIKKLLESEDLLRQYPHLRPQVSKHRKAATNWSSDRLVTQAGQVIEFISVLGNARGFNTDEGLRLDMIALDDVDDQKDSPDTVQKKLDIIGSNVLGAGDERTDIVFAQNLIHPQSVCTKLRDNNAGILLNRHFVGPFPMCKHYDWVEEPVPGDTTGAKRYKVLNEVEGDFQPFDPAISLEYVEKLLNRLGPMRFERECQQNMTLISDEKDFREYAETHHVITYSEFRSFFERYKVPVWNKERRRLEIPSQWNVGIGQDFGTTPEHPTAVMTVARPNMNVPLHDSFFIMGEVVLPKYPRDVNQIAPLVSPKRVILAEKLHLARWNIREEQVTLRRMSHEQSAAKNAYSEDLEEDIKTYYSKWKAARGSGVPQIQNVLEINYELEHPFRKYPDNYPVEEKRGKPIAGRPKFYIVVPDDQGELRSDEAGHLYVAQPTDQHGAARLRAEFPLYWHKNTGKNKIFDDVVDALRGLMGEFVVLAQDLNQDERYQRWLASTHPELLPTSIAEVASESERSQLLAAAEVAEQEYKKSERQNRLDDPYSAMIQNREDDLGFDSGGFHEL